MIECRVLLIIHLSVSISSPSPTGKIALVYSPEPGLLHTPAQGKEFLFLSQILRKHLLVCLPSPAEVGTTPRSGGHNPEYLLPVYK